jgi:hypothetical protein
VNLLRHGDAHVYFRVSYNSGKPEAVAALIQNAKFKMRDLLCVAVVCTALSCSEPGTADFQFVPLDEYEYKHADIQKGELIDLIAFSGGPQDNTETIFYYQFIGVRKSKGDTVRILTPLISVPGDTSKDQIHSSPLLYNPDKGITTAEYRPFDSTHVVLLEGERFSEGLGNGRSLDRGDLYKITQKQMVVLNQRIDLFQGHYPTAVGILHFEGVVW